MPAACPKDSSRDRPRLVRVQPVVRLMTCCSSGQEKRASESRIPRPQIPPPQGAGGGGEAANGGGQASTGPSGALSGAALLAAVAEARGMPESLIERSASARAKTAGVDVDDILRDWAEEEGLLEAPVAPASSPADSSPSSQIPPPQGEVPPPGGGGGQASAAPEPSSDTPAAGALSGAALLAAVAEARKMPESLVERSAKARAKSAGGTVDDVLLEWAEEEGIDVSAFLSLGHLPLRGRWQRRSRRRRGSDIDRVRARCRCGRRGSSVSRARTEFRYPRCGCFVGCRAARGGGRSSEDARVVG